MTTTRKQITAMAGLVALAAVIVVTPLATQQANATDGDNKLFSKGKAPIEVAVALNLRESEVTNFYKEYWRLNHMYDLNMIYEELKRYVMLKAILHLLSNYIGQLKLQV